MHGMIQFMKRMNPGHMSADSSGGEGANHPLAYKIRRSAWMSRELEDYFHAADRMFREDWSKPFGRRRTPGNPPRTRIPSNKPPDPHAVAPQGLPVNFYSKEWLSTLKPYQLAELDTQGAWDLTIPEDCDELESEDHHPQVRRGLLGKRGAVSTPERPGPSRYMEIDSDV
jgi:hypothetical protein